jgi:hypothetical protein
MMERQNRMWLVSGIISALVGLAAGFVGGYLVPRPPAEFPAIIRAEQFQLVDPAGRVRGQLRLDEHGQAGVSLFGQDAGMPLVSMEVSPNGDARLRLGDANRQRAVELTTEPQGSQLIALYHNGKPRLGLQLQQNGDPGIRFYDQAKRLISLGLTSQGDPHLTFYGDHQKPALDIVSRKNGDRSLDMMATNGIPRIVLGLKNDQKAGLGLFDRQGKTRVALMDEPSLFLLKNGKVVRMLP